MTLSRGVLRPGTAPNYYLLEDVRRSKPLGLDCHYKAWRKRERWRDDFPWKSHLQQQKKTFSKRISVVPHKPQCPSFTCGASHGTFKPSTFQTTPLDYTKWRTPPPRHPFALALPAGERIRPSSSCRQRRAAGRKSTAGANTPPFRPGLPVVLADLAAPHPPTNPASIVVSAAWGKMETLYLSSSFAFQLGSRSLRLDSGRKPQGPQLGPSHLPVPSIFTERKARKKWHVCGMGWDRASRAFAFPPCEPDGLVFGYLPEMGGAFRGSVGCF